MIGKRAGGDQLPMLARQAVYALGVEILQDIGKRVEAGVTGQMTLNFLNGQIPSWSMLERNERKKKEPLCG